MNCAIPSRSISSSSTIKSVYKPILPFSISPAYKIIYFIIICKICLQNVALVQEECRICTGTAGKNVIS